MEKKVDLQDKRKLEPYIKLSRKVNKKLGIQFEKLLQERSFTQKTIPDIRERIDRVRSFYRSLSKRYLNLS